MAFFKFRKSSDDAPGPAPEAQSLDELRQRARHRLIGSVVLVAVGVIGFPLFFDTQPRPVSVDLPITIPNKESVRPLVVSPPAQAIPVPSVDTNAADSASATTPATAPAAPSPVPPSPVPPSPVPPSPVTATPAKPSADTAAAVKPTPARDDGSRAKSLLEGDAAAATSVKPAISDTKFTVQVGSFTENAKAREVRLKVEKAGFKTYVQVVQLAEGRRIRVRVVPVATKAEAQKQAEQIRKLDLPVSVLEL